jgi:D-alanyl-D-alanine endopeptidase (penicillin-binding protein 7)
MSLEFAMNAWGWALLNFVWQGAVVGAGAALLLGLLRGASARWRYAVCAASLGLCLGLPLAQCLNLAPADAEFTGELPALVEQMPALVTAWALGTGLMLARLALGLAWMAGAAGSARAPSRPAPHGQPAAAARTGRPDHRRRAEALRAAAGRAAQPPAGGPARSAAGP